MKTIACPHCDVAVSLPTVAVRLGGRLACDNCNQPFAYDWRQYYHKNGVIRGKENEEN